MAGKLFDKSERKEDHALEPVPMEFRRRWPGIMNVALGVATAMVFMQMGSLMALTYGSMNAFLAEVYATIIAGVFGVAIAYGAARTGLNANLMARGAGYGSVGASLTSLIYALNFVMYFAIEGSIMAAAIHAYIPAIPSWFLMIVVGIGVIPLNWYGIRQLDRFQKWSIPVYVVLLVAGIVVSAMAVLPHSGDWLSFLPKGQHVGGVALLYSIGIINGLVGIMALLVSDYARFVKPNELKVGSFFVGFGPQLVAFFISGLIGIWFGVRYNEVNPGIYFVSSLGVWGALFAILTQLRINVTNLYSGSLSLSNFFEHVFHFTPGRVFWVVITAVAATTGMLLGALNYIGPLLTFQGVFLLVWVSSLVADVLVVKRVLKLGPANIEYRAEHLRKWNPVGVWSLIISSLIGSLMVFGVMGSFWQSIAAFAAAVIEFVLYIVLAVVTGGKYYTTEEDSESVAEISII
ncbi:MAG: purine-cytosine permease family protein [Bacilli bacterium]